MLNIHCFIAFLDERQELLEKFLEKCSDHDRKLAIAAMIIEEMRAEVKKQTQFRCSAGISTNKV